jgi:hypothetical protein
VSADRTATPFDLFQLGRCAGPWEDRIVYVCYLDDSDTQLGRNACIAGYYTRVGNWVAFEQAVEPIFLKYSVEVMRGKDLRDGRNDFKGWDRDKKSSFVREVFSVGGRHIVEGVSACVDKKWYAASEKVKETRSLRSIPPIGLAFSTVVNSISFQSPVAEDIEKDGISFMVETGNKNNASLERYFSFLQKAEWGSILQNSAISFVDKRSCRAVQMADMLAFYSRREMNKNNPRIVPRKFENVDPIFDIIRKSIWHRYNHVWEDRPEPDFDNMSEADFDRICLPVIPAKGLGH